MRTEDLDAIRARHRPATIRGVENLCEECTFDLPEPWPCDAARLLEALDGLKEATVYILGAADYDQECDCTHCVEVLRLLSRLDDETRCPPKR